MTNDFILAEWLSHTIDCEVAKAIPKTVNGHELTTKVRLRPSYDDDDMHVTITVMCPVLQIYESRSFAVNLYEYEVDKKKAIDLTKHMIDSILANIKEKEEQYDCIVRHRRSSE